MIVDHFMSLRKEDRTKESFIAVCMETNTYWQDTKRVERLVCGEDSKVPNKHLIWFVSRDDSGKNRPGVRTQQEEKRVGADELRAALMDGVLLYAQRFFTNTAASPALLRKKMEDQIQYYRHEVDVPKDGGVFGKIKESWTGKGPGGRNDDLCWVLQMCLLWSVRLRKDDGFIKLANQNGWRLC